MRKIWLIVFSLLLVIGQGNVSEAETAYAYATVSLTVPVYLEIGEIPDTVIEVEDPTSIQKWSESVDFSVKTNVRADLSVPQTTILNQVDGTETLEVMHGLIPDSVEPPGQDVCWKLSWVNIKGLDTMAGTYEGKVTITMSPAS